MHNTSNKGIMIKGRIAGLSLWGIVFNFIALLNEGTISVFHHGTIYNKLSHVSRDFRLFFRRWQSVQFKPLFFARRRYAGQAARASVTSAAFAVLHGATTAAPRLDRPGFIQPERAHCGESFLKPGHMQHAAFDVHMREQ
jgi:hypothetical protein